MLDKKLIEILDNKITSHVEIFENFNEYSAVSILESLAFDGTIDINNDRLCDDVLSYLLNTNINWEE